MKLPSPMLTVSCPPFVHCGATARGRMLEFLLALAPAAVMAAVTYGLPAVRVMALSMAVAVFVEWGCFRLMRREPEIDDCNALLLGLLFAFLLPASAPWWLVAAGSAITIVMGKMIFGGLGGAPLAAPVVGWTICRLSWPTPLDFDVSMLNSPLIWPLSQLKHFGPAAAARFTDMDLLLGHQLGGLGATQVLALLIGGAYLLLRGHIRWHIPLAFLAGTALAAWVFQAAYPAQTVGPLFHVLAGSTVFAAFFLATDHSSSPKGPLPMLLYGLLGGIMVMVIRFWGVYPDGAAFAVLLANLSTPLVDRIRPKPFGGA